MNSGFRHAGFFVVRTPLLPLAAFERIASDGLDRGLLHDPAVREAISLASPVFDAELARVPHDAPLPPRVHRTLVRYLVRMSARPTPLGLLAGCSWGAVGDGPSGVALVDRSQYRRACRPDVRAWAAAADAAVATADDAALACLRFKVNPDAHRREGHLRLGRLVPEDAGDATEFVEFPVDAALARVLEQANDEAHGSELVRALVAGGHAEDAAQASDYLRAVAGAGILVTELHPRMTGTTSVSGAETDALLPVATRRAHEVLAELDGSALAQPASAHRETRPWDTTPSADFGSGPVVDLWKPVESARLGTKLVDELGAALDVLGRLSLWRPHGALEAFETAFLDRYDEQWELDTLPLGQRLGVPLLEALDPETGIPFGGGTSADDAPLIDSLHFPPAEPTSHGAGSRAVSAHLLDAVVRCAASGQTEWVLSDADLDVIATSDPTEFPDSAALVATRARVDGRSRWVLRGVSGPAATGRVARAAWSDPGLARALRDFCAGEQEQRPDALIVDFVHQPPGRAANLAVHPSLRGHECHLHGLGAEASATVTLADLRITMRAGELVLFSASWGREVLPRLPSSYNHEISPFPLVRFLGALQHRRDRRDLGWHWADLDASPFLPRVVRAGVVLAPARWRLSAEDLAGLVGAKGRGALLREAALLRSRRRLPRVVGIVHADLVLPVELGSAELLDQLVAVARSDGDVVVTEVFHDEDEPLVTGPEGRFVHEVVVPFTRSRAETRRVVQGSALPLDGGTATETASRTIDRPLVYPPGSGWLHAEVFCGSADVDQIVARVGEQVAKWPVDRWFFVRYDLPGWHVRLRFSGAADALVGQVLPALRDVLAGPAFSGRVSRWTVDTYRPEVERYGGRTGLEVCHEVFHADSRAVARLAELRALDDSRRRWQLALRGASDLMLAADLDGPQRLALVERARDRFRWEHQADAAFVRAVGLQYRADRDLVEEALDGSWPEEAVLREVLAARHADLRASLGRLRLLEAEGRLNRPAADIAPSLLHMSLNRLLVSEHRAQETVLYDYLARAERSLAGKAASARTTPPWLGLDVP